MSTNTDAVAPITVDREMYAVAFVLCTLQELKDKGLVDGGGNHNFKVLRAIVELGNAMGFAKPDEREIVGLLDEFRENGIVRRSPPAATPEPRDE